MTNGTPAAYGMWMMELVRVTARRLGSSVTLLGGAPDPYEQRMIKSATPLAFLLFVPSYFKATDIHVEEGAQVDKEGCPLVCGE